MQYYFFLCIAFAKYDFRCPDFPHMELFIDDLCDGVKSCVGGADEDPQFCRGITSFRFKKLSI